MNDDNFDSEILKKSNSLYKYMYDKLNTDQKHIFDEIIKCNKKIYFIDGPGGSGKTFLYKTLIHYFISRKQKILSMAWTGIASILLPKGMTSHRTFRLPLNLNNIEISTLMNTDKRKLRLSNVIIWDEASMIPKKALEIVDRTLRDVTNINEPFGGKLIILGGDFRQILPITKTHSEEIIIEETIKNSYLWELFRIMKLTINMRSIDKNFSKLLLDIGEGKIDYFKIPNDWLTTDICSKIYADINNIYSKSINKVILAAHNTDVSYLNKKILNLLPGKIYEYKSIDYATYKGVDESDENIYLKYPVEDLNKMSEGLPPHKLNLKINCIVMLIRNLSISDGLCNGTRLKVINLYNYNIECKILTGDKAETKVFIPKITLNTGEDSSLPYILYRRQFPLILAFAMTINKSQGQSFDVVGLYIDKPLFSHGQLYVALSRCKNPQQIFVQLQFSTNNEIKNIVWKKIFN